MKKFKSWAVIDISGKIPVYDRCYLITKDLEFAKNSCLPTDDIIRVEIKEIKKKK